MSTHAPEATVAGRYVLKRVLGRGAMGVVWLATDTTLGRDVAIKEIELPDPIDAAERDGLRARVMREARAAAQLGHPNAVTVFDVVEEDGRPWIVMELIAAPTLQEVIAESGPLSPERAAVLGTDILAALAAAHRLGIVHRDVKPANVMVEESGSAKLADFGIAAMKDDPKITATGLVLGSPSFMAPEQAHSQGSGPAADLWSLGATLYYAVEGRVPFDKGAAIPTLTSVIEDEPPFPSRAGALAPVIGALMAKDPGDRPDVETVERGLGAVARGEATLPAPPPTVARPAPALRPEPRSTPRRSHRLPILAGGIVLAGLIVLGVMWITSRGDEPANAPRPPRPEELSEAARPPALLPGWDRYTDPTYGWSIAKPTEWEVQAQSVDETSVDLRDPESGTYLRVDWTTTPGDDAVAAWEAQAEGFAAEHADYFELGIAPDEFRGWPAATWEFTYTESGAALHALDLGFVIDGEYGFALYFQTHAEDWESMQDTFAAFKRSFRPPR